MQKTFSLSFPLTLALALWFLLLAAVQPAAAQRRRGGDIVRGLDVFNAVYLDLERHYVDTLDNRRLLRDAVDGLLEQIDPYTEYFPESRTDELQQMATGKYAGIGALIGVRPDLDRCIISFPYEGQPAAEVGLRPGDILMAIGGTTLPPIGTTPPDEYSKAVSNRLRGAAGTQFDITVQRPGIARPLTFTVRRRTIVIPSLTAAFMADDSTAYMLLNGYTEHTARDVKLALVNLKRQGARRLVLDLRGNGGGLMEEAVQLVSLFVPRGSTVLYTRGRQPADSTAYATTADPIDQTMPMVVLTDYGTASSAEITAGALQDYDRAVVMGSRTYGKGLVQETHEMPYGGVLKLTTSKYYIPSGRCIQAYRFENGQPVALPDSLAHTFHTAAGRPVRDAGGISPDVEVKSDTLPNMLYELEQSDAFFDFCVHYRNTHPAIAEPEDFHLTDADYDALCQWLKDRHFTYDRRSLETLKHLRRLAEAEGYGEVARAELDALEAKLSPNADFDLRLWKDDIRRLAEMTIVSFYYYEKGIVRARLPHDKVMTEALRLLNDGARYRAILAAPGGAVH